MLLFFLALPCLAFAIKEENTSLSPVNVECCAKESNTRAAAIASALECLSDDKLETLQLLSLLDTKNIPFCLFNRLSKDTISYDISRDYKGLLKEHKVGNTLTIAMDDTVKEQLKLICFKGASQSDYQGIATKIKKRCSEIIEVLRENYELGEQPPKKIENYQKIHSHLDGLINLLYNNIFIKNCPELEQIVFFDRNDFDLQFLTQAAEVKFELGYCNETWAIMRRAADLIDAIDQSKRNKEWAKAALDCYIMCAVVSEYTPEKELHRKKFFEKAENIFINNQKIFNDQDTANLYQNLANFYYNREGAQCNLNKMEECLLKIASVSDISSFSNVKFHVEKKKIKHLPIFYHTCGLYFLAKSRLLPETKEESLKMATRYYEYLLFENKNLLPYNNENKSSAIRRLADAYFESGRTQEALKQVSTAIEILKSNKLEGYSLILCLNLKAVILARLGELDESLLSYESALDLLEKNFPFKGEDIAKIKTKIDALKRA